MQPVFVSYRASQKKQGARCNPEPYRRPPWRTNVNLKTRALFIPNAKVVGPLDTENIIPRR